MPCSLSDIRLRVCLFLAGISNYVLWSSQPIPFAKLLHRWEGDNVLYGEDALREELLDYCGTASFGGNLAAMAEVSNIERADEHELREIACELGIDAGAYFDELDEDVGW